MAEEKAKQSKGKLETFDILGACFVIATAVVSLLTVFHGYLV